MVVRQGESLRVEGRDDDETPRHVTSETGHKLRIPNEGVCVRLREEGVRRGCSFKNTFRLHEGCRAFEIMNIEKEDKIK